MVDYRTDSLIADIKRQGSVPTNQSLLTNSDFIAFLNDNQRIYMIPAILRAREEFFVSTFNIALDPSLTIQSYALPPRAVGHKLRMVAIVDSQQNECILPRIEPVNKTWHETFAWWPGTKSGYYFEGNRIILTPNLSGTNNTLRLKYYRRPNWLVSNDSAAVIESINSITGELTVDSLPSSFAVNGLVDIINPKPTFDSRADDATITAINTLTPSLTVAPATAALLSVGDYVTNAGETIVPQYPEELLPMLTQLALVDVLKAIGDSQGAVDAEEALAEMERSLNSLIKSRDDGSPRKVMTRRGLWDTGGV